MRCNEDMHIKMVVCIHCKFLRVHVCSGLLLWVLSSKVAYRVLQKTHAHRHRLWYYLLPVHFGKQRQTLAAITLSDSLFTIIHFYTEMFTFTCLKKEISAQYIFKYKHTLDIMIT